MKKSRSELAVAKGFIGLSALLFCGACQLVEPAASPEAEETVTESEGQTEVTVTPLEPEPELAKADPDAPVSPREGVHETGEETRGRLAPATISSVLAAHNKEFTSCYTAESAKDPTLQGRVSLLLVIGADGSVPNARVMAEHSTLSNQKVHECLVREAKTLSFDKPEGGRVVTEYPLDFKPLPPPESAPGEPSLPAKTAE